MEWNTVFKLLHRLGTASPNGHTGIMRLNSQWKNIKSKFTNSLAVKRRLAPSQGGGGNGDRQPQSSIGTGIMESLSFSLS